MQIFNYAPVSGEYLSATLANPSPLEPGVFLIPANATELVPPTQAVGEVAVFKDGAWECVTDQRGEWYDAQGQRCVVDQVDADTSALTRVPPPSEFHDLAGGAWVLNVARLAASQLERFTAAIQKRLDDFARTRNYDSILSACTYATSAVTKFNTEGQACVNLRDATWAAAYDILAEVEAGNRPMPQNLNDIEADLPALVWPN